MHSAVPHSPVKPEHGVRLVDVGNSERSSQVGVCTKGGHVTAREGIVIGFTEGKESFVLRREINIPVNLNASQKLNGSRNIQPDQCS